MSRGSTKEHPSSPTKGASAPSVIGRYLFILRYCIVPYDGASKAERLSLQGDDGVDAGGAAVPAVAAAAVRTRPAQQQPHAGREGDLSGAFAAVPARRVPAVRRAGRRALGTVGVPRAATAGAPPPRVGLGATAAAAVVRGRRRGRGRRPGRRSCAAPERAAAPPVLAVPGSARVAGLLAGFAARRLAAPASAPAPAAAARAAQPHLVHHYRLLTYIHNLNTERFLRNKGEVVHLAGLLASQPHVTRAF